jgi:pyruvate ferredoxin oxidoreductase gamma subunit
MRLTAQKIAATLKHRTPHDNKPLFVLMFLCSPNPYAGVIARQRLSKLQKDAAAKANNGIVGLEKAPMPACTGDSRTCRRGRRSISGAPGRSGPRCHLATPWFTGLLFTRTTLPRRMCCQFLENKNPDQDRYVGDRTEGAGSAPPEAYILLFLIAGVPMTEIRIHGRGGQGNVIAAYILAQAAFECGKFAQAFPGFGSERQGAPVTAFVRITGIPIRCHCQVLQRAFLVLQDHALMHTPGITEGLLPEGKILVNWSKPIAPTTTSNGQEVVVIAAANLAMEYLGKPVPNTALLAALLTLTEMAPLEALEKALALRFRDETLERNIRLVRKVAQVVPAGLWKEAADALGH